MLTLPEVTICGVDTRTPNLGLAAIQRSMEAVRFGDAVLFTHGSVNGRTSDVRIVDIGPIRSIGEYSDFLLRGMAHRIHTDFVLITQWDGFVLDPAAWTSEFLQYDYIGAPWMGEPKWRAVGNGGFSLRSMRLLKALQDPAILVKHPEDLCICHLNRDILERTHGIRFAPYELAERFSHENLKPQGPTFGFHGIANLAEALSPAELEILVRSMTTEMSFGPGTRRLIRNLVYAGHFEPARILLHKRIAAGDRRWRVLSLWLRLLLLKALRLSSTSKRT